MNEIVVLASYLEPATIVFQSLGRSSSPVDLSEQLLWHHESETGKLPVKLSTEKFQMNLIVRSLLHLPDDPWPVPCLQAIVRRIRSRHTQSSPKRSERVWDTRCLQVPRVHHPKTITRCPREWFGNMPGRTVPGSVFSWALVLVSNHKQTARAVCSSTLVSRWNSPDGTSPLNRRISSTRAIFLTLHVFMTCSKLGGKTLHPPTG